MLAFLRRKQLFFSNIHLRNENGGHGTTADLDRQVPFKKYNT